MSPELHQYWVIHGYAVNRQLPRNSSPRGDVWWFTSSPISVLAETVGSLRIPDRQGIHEAKVIAPCLSSRKEDQRGGLTDRLRGLF